MCIPAHISLVICVSPQIWPPVICVSPTPLPSKQIQISSKHAIQVLVCKIFNLLAYDSGLQTSKHLSHTRTRMLFLRPAKSWFEEDANYSHRWYIFFKSFTHRRTLAYELATYVSYARCHVAEEKENGGFISLTRMKSSIKM